MKSDDQYTITQEMTPALGLRFVVRFNGVRIGSASDRYGADQVKRDHQKAVKAKKK